MAKYNDIEICWHTRRCSVNGEYGNFHVWEQWSEPVGERPLVGGPPAGAAAGVYGIVEFPDGIRRVDPASIKFVDQEHANLTGLCNALKKKDARTNNGGAIEVPISNADRIRAMGDEELAEFLNSWADQPWAWKREGGETICWLQQPAEVEA